MMPTATIQAVAAAVAVMAAEAVDAAAAAAADILIPAVLEYLVRW